MRGRPPKFTPEQQDDIRYLYRTTAMNLTQIARIFRCSPPTIARIVTGPFERENSSPPPDPKKSRSS